jgi:chromosome segregation ATPase
MPPRNGNGNGSTNVNNGLVSWAAVILAIFSAFWAVANPRDDIKTLKSDEQTQLTDFRHEVAATYTALVEHREFAKRLEEDVVKLQIQITELRKDQVSRSEHQQHWSDQTERINAVNAALGELRSQFVGSYNIGKQLDSLQKQLDQMRDAMTIKPMNLQAPTSTPPTKS